MTLPATEGFAGSAAVLPDPPWRQVALSAQTLNRDGSTHGKASAANASFDIIAYDDANIYANNQYAKATVGGLSSGVSFCGVCVRCSGTGGTFKGYELLTDGGVGGGHTEIFRYNAGAGTSIKTFTGGVLNGDTIELRAIGTCVYFLKNGSPIDSFDDGVSAIPSGAAGASVFNTTNNALLTNWEGGNMPVAIRNSRIMAPQQRMCV